MEGQQYWPKRWASEDEDATRDTAVDCPDRFEHEVAGLHGILRQTRTNGVELARAQLLYDGALLD